MKSLKESLLADIEDTFEAGDNFMHKEKELNTIHKFKASRWKNIYNGANLATSAEKVSVYKYVWDCPYILHMNKIKDLIDGDGHKIVFILYMEQSKSPVGKLTMSYLDIAVLDEDNRILNVYQQPLGSMYTSSISKTDIIKRISINYMAQFDENKLIEVLTSKKPDILYNFQYIKLISIANLVK